VARMPATKPVTRASGRRHLPAWIVNASVHVVPGAVAAGASYVHGSSPVPHRSAELPWIDHQVIGPLPIICTSTLRLVKVPAALVEAEGVENTSDYYRWIGTARVLHDANVDREVAVRRS